MCVLKVDVSQMVEKCALKKWHHCLKAKEAWSAEASRRSWEMLGLQPITSDLQAEERLWELKGLLSHLNKKIKSYTRELESINGIRYQEEEFSGGKRCIWQRAFHMWHQRSLGPFICLSPPGLSSTRMSERTESQVQSERRYVKTLVSHTWVGHVADF